MRTPATMLAVAAFAAISQGASAAPPPPAGHGDPGPNKHECLPFVSAAQRTSATCGATIAADGRAVPPPGAPSAVREVIEAANRISNRPYKWGGGHLSWNSRGYDCSGAVGYALHGA